MTAPSCSLTRAEWVACVLRCNTDTGEFERIEGPEGSESYHEHGDRLKRNP